MISRVIRPGDPGYEENPEPEGVGVAEGPRPGFGWGDGRRLGEENVKSGTGTSGSHE